MPDGLEHGQQCMDWNYDDGEVDAIPNKAMECALNAIWN
jgi:hypothetical protein